jgi:hypothetical protein
MNFDWIMRGVAIHSRNVTGRIVKTHQPMHFFDCGKGAIDIVGRSLACDIDKCAEQWPAAVNFSA